MLGVQSILPATAPTPSAGKLSLNLSDVPTQKLSLIEEAMEDETDDDLGNKPVSVRRKRQMNTISSDEDEDEDDTGSPSLSSTIEGREEKLKTNAETVEKEISKPSSELPLSEVMSAGANDDLYNKPLSVRRKRLLNSLSSDEDEEDAKSKGSPFPSTRENKEDNQKAGGETVGKEDISGSLLNTDIFDAETDEESSEDEPEIRKKRDRVTIHSDDGGGDDRERGKQIGSSDRKKTRIVVGSDSEEGSGSDGETSSKRLAKPLEPSEQEVNAENEGLTDKSRKRNRSPKPRRLKKEAIQKIHSESQRLIRESQLRLPYHKPKQLSVNDFFNKRPSAKTLKPIKGLTSSVLKDMRVKSPPKKDEDELPDPFREEKDSEKEERVPTDLLSQPTLSNEVCKDNSLGKEETPCDKSGQEKPSEDGSLEHPGTSREGCKGDAEGRSPQNDGGVSSIPSGEINKDGPHGVETETKLEHLPSTDGASSENKQCETTALEDNSCETKNTVESSGDKGLSRDDDTGINETPAHGGKKQSAAMRLLQASLDKLKKVTPKLSGETEQVICLDDDSLESQIPIKGVENLMERFAKHATKKPRGRKNRQEVQLSIIKKETNADGKEDLKEESISVILEPEEQEVNPKLRVPGAKLLHLKETLQVRMKERRELERKKRQEAYNIDNEEMLGDEEEEQEAELSEGETSDEDYKVEENAGSDSDEDDEEYDEDFLPHDTIREKCEFADDEAEDDDRDEDDDEDDENEDESDDDDEMEVEQGLGKTTTAKPTGDGSDDEISPGKKSKAASKRRILLSDDEDEDDNENKGDVKVSGDNIREPKNETPRKVSKESEIHPTETSNLSSISSKTSSVKKSDSSSVNHLFPDNGKTMDLFDSTSSLTDVKFNDINTEEKQTTFNFTAHLNRQDSNVSKSSELDNSSLNSLDNSLDLSAANIPPYQPRQDFISEADDSKMKEPFTPFSQTKSKLGSSPAKNTSKVPELSLPVEDSQDLFQMDSPSLTVPDSQRETETQNFKFSFEDDYTQTQFLDENGFLNLKSSVKRQAPKKIFSNENTTQGNMEELMGLCSGQFNVEEVKGDSQGPSSQASFKRGLFSQVQSQDNISELLGLCSGNFSDKKETLGSKAENTKGDSDDDSIASFGLIEDGKKLEDEKDGEEKLASFKKLLNKEQSMEELDPKDDLSSDDEPIILTRKKKPVEEKRLEYEDDEEELLLAYDSNEEFEFNANAFKGKTYSKFAKKRFLEEEAELSGSDFESDEDYDGEDEPDELIIDKEVEEKYKDQEKLREEINEAYMKSVDDEDDRRLRLFKELYLQDGDLYSEKSRVRKFRWKHLDEMEPGTLEKGDNSEDEKDDEDDQDTQWRLQRYQREQWLKEQESGKGKKSVEVAAPLEDENSQFAVLMKTALKNNSKGSSLDSSSNSGNQQTEKLKEKKEFNSPKPLKMLKHGSFLKRKKQDLEKLASVVKPLTNPTGPKNNNRSFIFQSLSQTTAAESDGSINSAKVKRSLSVSDSPASNSQGPKSKRPKLDRSISQKSSGSIFNHF
ncbi:Claspin [Holothuria leucospilota]|uniref:Claspin n=1 Tax=Holothuria leucospilota TaxID=206669 RepID=A0A9Q1CJ54_HOLLE|nr:Claspin [Holothuria leucospilota]